MPKALLVPLCALLLLPTTAAAAPAEPDDSEQGVRYIDLHPDPSYDEELGYDLLQPQSGCSGYVLNPRTLAHWRIITVRHDFLVELIRFTAAM